MQSWIDTVKFDMCRLQLIGIIFLVYKNRSRTVLDVKLQLREVSECWVVRLVTMNTKEMMKENVHYNLGHETADQDVRTVCKTSV